MAVEYSGENSDSYQMDEDTYINNGTLATATLFRRIAMNQTWLAVQDTEAMNFFTSTAGQTPTLGGGVTANIFIDIWMPPFSRYVEFYFLAEKDTDDQSNGAGGNTTIVAPSGGVNINTFVGAQNLNVASTANFPASGTVMVTTSLGVFPVTYTAKAAGQFQNCNSNGAAGVMTNTQSVYGIAPAYIQVATASTTRRNSLLRGGSNSTGKANFEGSREAEWVIFRGITGGGTSDDPTALPTLGGMVNNWNMVHILISCTANVKLFTGYYRVLPCTGPLSSWA